MDYGNWEEDKISSKMAHLSPPYIKHNTMQNAQFGPSNPLGIII
jgi:hypothetical protein